MKHITYTFIIVFFFKMSSINGQNDENRYWILKQRLPTWALNVFENHGLNNKFKFSDFINPFYLEADFNCDNRLDVAVAIEELATSKKGIIIFHGMSENYVVFGAGSSFGTGNDNFSWMDIWKVERDLYISELTFKANGDIDGNRDLKLFCPGIEVDASERSGGIIYWDGKQYKWAQTND
jgi:hypothetical protein